MPMMLDEEDERLGGEALMLTAKSPYGFVTQLAGALVDKGVSPREIFSELITVACILLAEEKGEGAIEEFLADIPPMIRDNVVKWRAHKARLREASN